MKFEVLFKTKKKWKMSIIYYKNNGIPCLYVSLKANSGDTSITLASDIANSLESDRQ